MLFLTCVMTGQKDFCEYNACSQPTSKSKIVSFDQLECADYLMVKPSSIASRNHHYLVVSVESSTECTVVGCDYKMLVTKEQLQLMTRDSPPSYYRVNYSGACESKHDSVKEALKFVGKTAIEYHTAEEFIHKLKTHEELEVNPSELEVMSKSSKPTKHITSVDYSREDSCTPKYIRHLTSYNMVPPGTHIIYRSSKPPHPPVYSSAIVLSKVEESQELKIVSITLDGIRETTHKFDSLPCLYQVFYHSCRSECEVVACARRLIITFKDKTHHYDEHCNNSHHFITRCMTGRDHPLTKLLNEIALKEQG